MLGSTRESAALGAGCGRSFARYPESRGGANQMKFRKRDDLPEIEALTLTEKIGEKL